jgi:hypothetical protein
MEEFIACFSEVSDPRQENVRHNLYEILIIALCAMLSGGEDCSDMAVFGRAKRPILRQFLRLEHGIPGHDTFSRVFRQLDPKPFHACFSSPNRRGQPDHLLLQGAGLRRRGSTLQGR